MSIGTFCARLMVKLSTPITLVAINDPSTIRQFLSTTCNLFLFFQPLACWRHVKVTDRRTKVDVAYCLRDLVDVYFPTALAIRLVLDNLNTPKPEVLYEVFEPAEARRTARKLEFHYTPKHGRWLNMVES